MYYFCSGFQILTGMKNRFFILMLLAGMALNIAHAQVVMQPAEPNEVCQQAWEKYHKGDVLWKTGWGLFVGGAVATAAGWGSFIPCSFGPGPDAPAEQKSKQTAAIAATLTIASVGSAAFVASIPCLIVGQVQRKKALKAYNEHCADQPPLTFSIQSSSNGLGLAMQF